MPHAYSYIRFSTPAQGRGDSLRRQLEASATYAAEHGLTLNTDFRDLGLSGFKGINRVKGALGEFLKRVENQEIASGSFLIVENLDRLTREEIVDALSMFLNVIASGITVVTLMDKQVYSRETVNANPMLLLISITILARGNEESRTKARRLAAKWEAKGLLVAKDGSGQKWTSVVPFWLRLEGRDRHERLAAPWTILDGADGGANRVGVVERIFRLALHMGSDSIMRILNDEGVPAPKRRDGWHGSTVKFILKDRRVLGELQRYTGAGKLKRQAVGEPIPDYFPQVIPAPLFYAVQKKIQGRRSGGGGQKGKRANLFTSITRCECGRPMEYRDRGYEKGRYLVCTGFRRKQRCTNGHRFTYGSLENLILDFVSDVEVSDIVAHKAAVAGLKLTGKQAESEDIQARIGRVRRDLEEEDDPREVAALKSRRKALRERLVALNVEIEALTVDANSGKRSPLDVRRAALKLIREEMAALDGHTLFEARSRLASAVRDVVNFLSFDADGSVYAILEGGLKAYWFHGGKYVGAFDYTDSVAFPDAKPWITKLREPPSQSLSCAHA